MERFLRRILIVLFILLVSISTVISLIFHFNLIDQINQQNQRNIEGVRQDLDTLFRLEERYGLINLDTAYLARIRNILLQGKATNDAENGSLVNATRFLQLAKGSSGAIHSIYVALLDKKGSYILSDTGLKNVKYLHDSSWLEDCFQSDRVDFNTTRLLATRTATNEARYTELLTFYHFIESRHWETGEAIQGCIIINFYLNPIKMQLKQALPNEKSVFVLKTDHWQYSTDLIDSDLQELLEDSDVIRAGSPNTRNREYVCYNAASEHHNISFYLICPKKELYSLVYNQLFATLLIAGAMIIISLYFFVIYQNQYKKYFESIRKILQISTESDVQMLDLRLPQSNINDLTSRILQNTIDRIEMKELLSQEQNKRSEMEILALQSQINPHFLLNTIDFMYWNQVRDFGFDSPQVRIMENLCSILKYALNPAFIVPFQQEIEMANRYIATQQLRKNLSVDFSVDVPDEIREMLVMKLILQPVLENCFQYGSQNKGSDPLKVSVSADIINEMIEIRIADNGTGMEDNKLCQINQDLKDGKVKSSHIGIRNINRRLQVYYGDGAGIRLAHNLGGGLLVIMHMKSILPENEEIQ